MRMLPASTWLPHYAASVLGYCWRCFRRRLPAWLATAVAIGAVLSLAASAELFLVLGERSLSHQAQSASEFQVFLSDEAGPSQVDTLTGRVATLPGVRKVTYRSKAEALNLARRDTTLANIAESGGTNPFPASLVVELSDPSAAGRVTAAVAGDSAADHEVPFSYSPAQGERLSGFLSLAKAVVLGVAVSGLTVATVVALVLIRSEVRARRPELTILALVGAPRPVIRLPVLVEAISLALAGSLMAMLTLAYVGSNLVSSVNDSLPFLRLGTSAGAIEAISLATLGSSVLTLGISSLLVRLPR